MDDELLPAVYHHLFPDGQAAATYDCTYPDAVIVLIQLFRVLHQLSAAQGIRKKRWPLWLRRLSFPSYSQFNRRVKTASVQAVIADLSEHFRRRLPQTGEKVCDGKPLLVGGFSKDPDAHNGKAPGGWARGYKLHAVIDSGGAVDAWAVTSLDVGEPTAAEPLLAGLNLTHAVVRSDSNYDSHTLYKTVADRGGRLIAPRKKPRTGLGHHPQHPDRLRAIAQLEQTADGRRNHERHRIRVEQIFGQLTTACGLWGLPPSVRRLARVRRWVAGKIALYHLRRWLQSRAAAQPPAA